MNNELYQRIIDEVYNKYKLDVEKSLDENSESPEEAQFFKSGLVLSKEDFFYEIKTDKYFAEKHGLKIEQRDLTLEERLEIADKFNPLIREDCLTKTHHPDETEELKLIYRHEWLDSLGPNVVPQRKLITITYNGEKIESYE
jgi:hypothetical protein